MSDQVGDRFLFVTVQGLLLRGWRGAVDLAEADKLGFRGKKITENSAQQKPPTLYKVSQN